MGGGSVLLFEVGLSRRSSTLHLGKTLPEFPKIRRPNLDPQRVGLLLHGHPPKRPQLVETAT